MYIVWVRYRSFATLASTSKKAINDAFYIYNDEDVANQKAEHISKNANVLFASVANVTKEYRGVHNG